MGLRSPSKVGAPTRSLRATEVAIVISFVVATGWAVVAGVRGGSLRVAVVLVVSGMVLFLARVLTTFSRIAAPALVLAAAVIAAVSARREILSAGPLSGPFGYANAKGAFFMLAAIAGLMMMVGATSVTLRVIGAAGAVAAGLVPATTDVVASTVLIVALPLPVMLFSMVGRWASRLAIALCGSLFILAVLSTALLGSRDWSAVDGPAATKIRDVLTYDRLELWHEAEQLMTQNPLRGIGPGRFGDVAPLSQVDPSNLLFWAQNDFLQQGAEQGVPGLLALVGLFVCGFVALWANPNPDAFVALAAVALAAVGIQACEDYVLHFPAVVLATAALVGAGVAPNGDSPSLNERGTGVPV